MSVRSPAHALGWLTTIAFLAAQCPTPDTWQAAGTCPAPAGSVAAMVRWDPDGPGPLGVHVVCGGEFTHAGASATANVAMYDPVARTWSALGAGLDGPVLALAVLGSGELIAGGAFTHSGAQSVARVARWNGTAWSPIGTGIGSAPNDAVAALAQLPSGALVAGGEFAIAGGVPAANIASWNGTAWSPLGSGILGTPAPAPPNARRVMHLGVRGNGELIAGGSFTTAGGVPAHCVARWSGGAWSSLGLTPPTMLVEAMSVLANGDAVVARSDQVSNHDVVRWNGSAWSSMGNTLVRFTAFCELGSGTLLGHTLDWFTALGDLVQWTGSAWASVPTADYTGPAAALVEIGPGDLLFGGPVYSRGLPTVLRRSANRWQAPAAGLDGWVNIVAVAPGEVVLGGWFRQIGDVQAQGVAVRRNGVWSALGGGVDGSAEAVLRSSNGDWIVGGSFTHAGGVPASNIARWNGSTWTPIGDPQVPVLAIAELPTGELVVSTYVATVLLWNGSVWAQIGSFYAPALAVLPNGDLVAGCMGNPLVQRYSGGTWSSLGLPVGVPLYESVTALHVLGNGDLLAGGSFGSTPTTLPHNLARWNGTSWTFLGQGVLSHVNDIDVLPNGDWLISHEGHDWNGQPRVSPSRWNGTTWSSIASLDVAPWMEVSCLGVDDAGELVVTGTFGSVQGVATGGVARRLAGCPAQAAASGAGCTGAAGPVVLAVQTRPWLGDAYRALTTGLPSPSLALEVFGFGTLSLPLASVLPQGVPGCTLHVTPDVLLAALPVAGRLHTTFPIPATVSLLGLTFRHQVVPVELSPAGAITGITASNALLMTLGTW